MCLYTGWGKMSHIRPIKAILWYRFPCLLLHRHLKASLYDHFSSFHLPISFPTRRHWCRDKSNMSQIKASTVYLSHPLQKWTHPLPHSIYFLCHLPLIAAQPATLVQYFSFQSFISSQPKARHLSETEKLLSGDSVTDSFTFLEQNSIMGGKMHASLYICLNFHESSFFKEVNVKNVLLSWRIAHADKCLDFTLCTNTATCWSSHQ